MKKLPPQSLDLGLEELIQNKKNDSLPSEEVKSQHKISEEGSSEVPALFSRGEFAKVISRTENLFSTDPEAAIYWIRSQAALGAVPISILVAPFEKTIYEMLNPDSPILLRSLAGDAAKEFMDSSHIDHEFKDRIKERMLMLGVELPTSVQTSPIENLEDFKQKEIPLNQRRSNSSGMILFLMILMAVVLYQLINHYSQGSSALYAVNDQPRPSKDLVTGDLKRQTVGSLDALLSDLNNQNASTQPTISPTIQATNQTSPVQVQPKETVNTDTPIEPDNLRESNRDSSPPEPRLNDEGREGFYEVLVETLVLSKPQIDSSPVTRLRPGALLEVVRRDGVFYEIKSKGGKSGYVLMQDVAPPIRHQDRGIYQGIRDRELFRNDSKTDDDSSSPPDPFSRESVERRYDR